MPLGVAPAAAAAACQGDSVRLVLAEVPMSRGNLRSRAGAGRWGLVQGPVDPAWPGPWRAAVSRLGGMLVEDVGEGPTQCRAGARAGHLGPLGIISGASDGHCLPGDCMAVPTPPVPLRSPPLELREHYEGSFVPRPLGPWCPLPSWLSGKESTGQCRRGRGCGFDPWVGMFGFHSSRHYFVLRNYQEALTYPSNLKM